jgi:hypothetical protein
MNEVQLGLFFTTSNEVIWSQKISYFMYGLKSAILSIFQKSAYWLDWSGLLVQPSISAHKKGWK